MPRLSIFTGKTISELMELYELSSTDMANLHRELGRLCSEYHGSYIEAYAHSNGKSVAERNRDADYQVSAMYREIVDIRCQINSLAATRALLVNLINWKVSDVSYEDGDSYETYPPDDLKGLSGGETY